MKAAREPTLEEGIDALEEGDVVLEVSAARAALRYRDFRVVWFGAMSSNVGTWMQNVTLGAFAYNLTKSPVFVSLTAFAQLGPQLILSLVGGVLADAMDRRKLILIAQVEQLVASAVLAVVAMHATQSHPHKLALLLTVLAVGIGSSLNAPAWSALVPSLVPRENIAGAISLNSTQMNAARVVGPAIGAPLYHLVGAPAVFGVNAATYLFAIIAMLAIPPQPFTRSAHGPKGVRRLAEGFQIARHQPVVRRALLTMAVFSFVCLPFIGQMPTIAARDLGLNPKSIQYGLLYASFGTGAVAGALSIGTFLQHQELRRLIQLGLGAFAVLLLTFALLSNPAPAYPVAAMVGFAYFATVTSLSTVLQEAIDNAVRGRVMALWQLSFGGMMPLGLMLAGPIAQAVSIRVVLVYGVVAAAGLSIYSGKQ